MKIALYVFLVGICVTLDHGCRAAHYIGCLEYTENIEHAVGFTQKFDEGLTRQKCNELCFKNGDIYAATKNGNTCLCINYDSKQNKPKEAEESSCDIKCNGDPSKKCGGENTISAYQTITSDVLNVGKSLGCYMDNRTERFLNESRSNLARTNSPQKCLNICRELKFKFSGVRNKQECYCGNVFNIPTGDDSRSLEVDDTKCHKLSCPGDPTQFCGDQSYINIYRTGEPDRIPPAGLGGCFNIRDDFVTEHMENMGDYTTPLRCMIRCFELGYKYAGIQLGIECHCRNSPQGLQPTDKSKCNVPCHGEVVASTENGCGGVGTISGYSLGISSYPGEVIGCFKDEKTYPVLDGYKADLVATNSPHRCINICVQLGFIYAGLRNGYKCLCGNTAPVNPELVSDMECNMECPGNQTEKCGGKERLFIYHTGYDPSKFDGDDNGKKCIKSVTKVNGVNVCKSAVIFKDTFNSPQLNSKWQHSIRFSGNEEFEFVTYTSDSTHVRVEDSRLKIFPTLLPSDVVMNGDWNLEGCTGNLGTDQCERKAIAYSILPPIQSASVNTKDAFNFQYGIVTIRAQVPVGDWIVPQFYLRSKDESYGPGYKSGIIRIGTVKGNKNLVCGNQSLGLKHVEHGVLLGDGKNVRGRTIKRSSDQPWHYKFHNYTVHWGPDKIAFFVDNIQAKELLPTSDSVLSEVVGFTPEESIWKEGSKLAPFDKEFYISIGVSVGGMREFDDDCISDGHPKPWGNGKVKSMLHFWQDNPTWHKTWSEKAHLKVESVVVTAL